MHWLTLLARGSYTPLPLHDSSPRVHALPLSAGLSGHAVRVLEAVDLGQVHVLGDAGHVRRVQLLVAVGTPEELEMWLEVVQ